MKERKMEKIESIFNKRNVQNHAKAKRLEWIIHV